MRDALSLRATRAGRISLQSFARIALLLASKDGAQRSARCLQ
jgi:hypothetical protein